MPTGARRAMSQTHVRRAASVIIDRIEFWFDGDVIFVGPPFLQFASVFVLEEVGSGAKRRVNARKYVFAGCLSVTPFSSSRNRSLAEHNKILTQAIGPTPILLSYSDPQGRLQRPT
jgi:hypothetical protein